MKVLTQQDLDEYQWVSAVGGAKGGAAGLAFAIPASYLLQKRWAYYRGLPLGLKALGVMIVTVPAFAIKAEHAGLEYERAHWTGAGKAEIESQEAQEQLRWQNLPLRQKVSETVENHQYGCIIGAWAVTLAGSFGYIMRDPYQTTAQKIVQARMWAQGLTIGIIVAAGVIAHVNRAKGGQQTKAVDHSWRDIIEQEQKLEEARQQQGRITT